MEKLQETWKMRILVIVNTLFQLFKGSWMVLWEDFIPQSLTNVPEV